jgi:hypothetical protein
VAIRSKLAQKSGRNGRTCRYCTRATKETESHLGWAHMGRNSFDLISRSLAGAEKRRDWFRLSSGWLPTLTQLCKPTNVRCRTPRNALGPVI